MPLVCAYNACAHYTNGTSFFFFYFIVIHKFSVYELDFKWLKFHYLCSIFHSPPSLCPAKSGYLMYHNFVFSLNFSFRRSNWYWEYRKAIKHRFLLVSVADRHCQHFFRNRPLRTGISIFCCCWLFFNLFVVVGWVQQVKKGEEQVKKKQKEIESEWKKTAKRSSSERQCEKKRFRVTYTHKYWRKPAER